MLTDCTNLPAKQTAIAESAALPVPVASRWIYDADTIADMVSGFTL